HLGRGMAVPGGGDRLVLAPGGRMVDEFDDDRSARHRCLDDGAVAARQAGGIDEPFRSGQYTSEDFQRLLDDQGITCSMSKRGDVWDNAAMESFFSSLKIERIYRKKYVTREEVRADVFDYIEMFYNPRRRHSTLGQISPVEFEKRYAVLAKCP